MCAIDDFNNNISKTPHRTKQYKKYINDPIFSDFEYPMKIDDINKF